MSLDHGLPADAGGVVGGNMPTDRSIDGVDHSDLLLSRSPVGARDKLRSFIGPQLVAARWKQWRVYFTDIHPIGSGPQILGGAASASGAMAGYETRRCCHRPFV